MMLKQYVDKYLPYLLVNFKKPINLPTSIMFNISPSCILKCQQCDIWRNPPTQPINFEESKILIDKIYDWLGPYYLFLTGGEPLMNPHLIKIIQYCATKNISTHLNTNAYLINDKVAKDLANSGLTALSISLDGAKASTHDALRGKDGVYLQAIKAIKLINKHKKNGVPKIFINTVIMSSNTNELVDLVKLTKILKTDGINFQCLLPNLGVIHESPTFDLWPSLSKLKPVIKKILKKLPQNPHILHHQSFFENVINYYQNPHFLDKTPCFAGINNFIFDHKGQVNLCFQFGSIGNLFKDSAKNIWLNQKAQHQRLLIKKCKQPCKIIACNQFK